MYDLAKVYQSIVGYDFILLDHDLKKSSITHYKEIFKDLILSKNIDFEIIKNITKSLLFSLLPLHKDQNKVEKYFNLIHTV
jgi:hypothetical protein